MRYCINCGKEMEEQDKYCHYCGSSQINDNDKSNTALDSIIKILLILFLIVKVVSGIILTFGFTILCNPYTIVFWLILVSASCLLLLSLLWNIPMAIYAFKKIKKQKSLSLPFSVCYLIFCNLIIGILLIIRKTVLNK